MSPAPAIIRFSAPIAFQADAAGTISGYGSTFSNEPNLNGFTVAPGAFDKTLKAHRSAGTAPAMLWGHNMQEPIGRWLEMKPDARGLWCHGTISQETQRGREVLALVKQGGVTGLSIGCSGESIIEMRDPKSTVFELVEADLLEVSPCSIPADRGARIAHVAAVTSRRTFEAFLKEAGFANTLAAKLAASWPGSNEAAPSPEIKTLADRVKAATAAIRKV